MSCLFLLTLFCNPLSLFGDSLSRCCCKFLLLFFGNALLYRRCTTARFFGKTLLLDG